MKPTEFRKKPTYRKTIYFNEEFVPDLEIFFKNIKVDPRISSKSFKNETQRFSAVLRILIRRYNNGFNEYLKEKYKENATPNASD